MMKYVTWNESLPKTSFLANINNITQGDRVSGTYEHARVHGGRVLPRPTPGGRARALHTGGRDECCGESAELRSRYVLLIYFLTIDYFGVADGS